MIYLFACCATSPQCRLLFGTLQDITLKGLNAVKGSAAVYLEAYTSILGVPRERLEALFGKTVELAPRELVESYIEPVRACGIFAVAPHS